MRKITITGILAIVILLIFSLNVFADRGVIIDGWGEEETAVNVEEIQNIQYYKVALDLSNEEEVENLLRLYIVGDETAKSIRQSVEAYSQGKIAESTIVLETSYNPRTRAMTEYIGFGNRRYRKEALYVPNTSNIVTINSGSNFSNYTNSLISGVAKYWTNKGLNYVTGGSWSLANLLISALPSGVGTNTSYTHRACLVENKTKVFVYVQEGSGWYFGSKTEKSNYHFQNYASFPGYNVKEGRITGNMYCATDSYGAPEQAAYYGYAMGGASESIDGYTYGGLSFNSPG